jgi:hypothetical protein
LPTLSRPFSLVLLYFLCILNCVSPGKTVQIICLNLQS